MTKTLIIHDGEGYILDTRSGQPAPPAPREPQGVPFLWADIPENKRIKITEGIGVDVLATPHQVILEDIPPTEIELLQHENQLLKAQNNALAERAEFVEDLIAEMAMEIYQ